MGISLSVLERPPTMIPWHALATRSRTGSSSASLARGRAGCVGYPRSLFLARPTSRSFAYSRSSSMVGP